ncbi:hypothetical protein [Algibacter sp. Ld11]|uniref:hypothetical protein n=1 Tax=Algibacter sp. Ld11 TaxID=649150 RepID=UPI00386D32E7
MFISQAYHCYHLQQEEKNSNSKLDNQKKENTSFLEKVKQVFNTRNRVYQSY